MKLEKKFYGRIIVLLFCAGLFCLGMRAQAVVEERPFRGLPVRSDLATLSIERRVEDLLKQMTLEEKVGQLVQYSIGTPTGPGTGRGGYEEMIASGQVGSLFNLEDVKAANRYQHIAMDKSRLHIPMLIGLDVIHGYRTVFPVPLGLASTWDPPVVERAARVAAEEATADGVRWTFSPMVDIARDARWGRMVEGAGEDPFLGSEMARAYVRGYQGKNLDAADSMAACAKHYVGYGAAEGGRDYNSVELSEHTLREVYLPPFYAALDEGSVSIMSAFNPLNSVPASANAFTLKQVLRKEWQFQGMVVSDWTSVEELIAHGIANDGGTAAKRAFAAGVDMDMESNLYHQHLADLIKIGKVSEEQLDEAVRHVLRVKFALGLFDRPFTEETRKKEGPLERESLEIARVAAERSFVLLKNANGKDVQPVLPLKKGQTVALIGPLADSAGNMLGAWAGRGRPEDVVTLKAALTQETGVALVKYAPGGEILTSTDKDIADAVAIAKKASVAILALGEEAPEMTGEAGSRAHLELPGRQEELLEKVAATGTPVVLVLFSGRPLTLPWAFEHVPAVLEAWFPGVQAGPALSRILYGEVVPSGRLVVSWPRTVGQLPLYYNALSTGRPSGKVDLSHPPKDGMEKYVSRYIDEENSPQFPFGYGLSYTTFEYTAVEASATKISAKSLNENLRKRNADQKQDVLVAVKVTNRGQVAAEETVQLYVSLRGTSVAEPVKSLKAFQRVSLSPGDTKKVIFQLEPEAFALWGGGNDLGVESGKATIWVGPNSAQAEGVELEIAD
ncbi:MAG TPA: beta-glucosidase BglX [Candidatus Acidoferrum sp.]